LTSKVVDVAEGVSRVVLRVLGVEQDRIVNMYIDSPALRLVAA
jgi:hypothetical protein